MSSPQMAHRTGIDSLLHESEPDRFTEVYTSPSSISVLTVAQPLSLEEQYKETERQIMMTLAWFRRHVDEGTMTPDLYERFCEAAEPLFEFLRSEESRTLLKNQAAKSASGH